MNPIARLIAQFFSQSPEQQITPLERLTNNLGHNATRQHHNGRRGKGFTKASHEESKARRKMAARSRRINRKQR